MNTGKHYEAKEKVILKAIARVFREKNIGSNVRINNEKQTGGNRLLSFKVIGGQEAALESENSIGKNVKLVLSIITEKKTETGWEMRRLLDKEQYEIFQCYRIKDI